MHKLTRAERFKDARTVHNRHGSQSMDDVYKATGVSASMIKDLEDDEKSRSVGYEKVAMLARHYGVSTDYLLGMADVPSKSYDVRCLAELTGLTQEAIEAILDARCGPNPMQLASLSYMLANGFFDFGVLSNFTRMEADVILMERHMPEYRKAKTESEQINWMQEYVRLKDDIDVAKFKADNIFRKMMEDYFSRIKDPGTPEHKRIEGILEPMDHSVAVALELLSVPPEALAEDAPD